MEITKKLSGLLGLSSTLLPMQYKMIKNGCAMISQQFSLEKYISNKHQESLYEAVAIGTTAFTAAIATKQCLIPTQKEFDKLLANDLDKLLALTLFINCGKVLYQHISQQQENESDDMIAAMGASPDCCSCD